MEILWAKAIRKRSEAERSQDGNVGLFKRVSLNYFPRVSTVREIEEVIPRLSRAEVEALRDWIDDYLEQSMQLSDEVIAKIEQSKREIAAGNFTVKQPK